jgi:hypothetical protein
MGLDEERVLQVRLASAHGAIESLDVSHLDDAALLFGQGYEPVRFVRRRGDGFLDEQIAPVFECDDTHIKVTAGMDGDGDRLGFLQKLVERRAGSRVQFSGHRLGAPVIDVIDPN